MTDSIVCENISKCYKLGKKRINFSTIMEFFGIANRKDNSAEIWALKNINFAVQEGEVLGIIGRNGAGKTTLLRVLGRITSPSLGKAYIKGRVYSLLEIGAGMQPENTGRENIYINAAFYGLKRHEINKMFDEIVSFAELEQFIDTPVRHYSSGMYLRLAFSMAINMKPNVLLADEVLAVGDISFQKRCMDRMEQIGKSGVTVLFVSHDMEAIKRMCTRCIWLDYGQIVYSGDPLDTVQKFQENLLHNVPLNNPLLEGEIIQINVGNGKKSFKNDYFEIVSARLLSDGMQTIGVAKASEDFVISINFDIFKPEGRLSALIDLFCGDSLVFRSGYPDLINVTESGKYTANIHVPKNLLAEREYFINIMAQVYIGEKKYPVVWSNALSFRVYYSDKNASEVEILNYNRYALTNPVLEWSFTKN